MKTLRQTNTMKTKLVRNELTKGKPHGTVTAMVRDLIDDPEFVDELNAHLNDRQLVKMLAVLRARAGLTQQELGGKAECKQPRISKLESGVDADLRFGDVIAYLKATGHGARIFFLPAGSTLADEVKMHAGIIEELLARVTLHPSPEQPPGLIQVEAPRMEEKQQKSQRYRIRAGTAFGTVLRLEGA